MLDNKGLEIHELRIRVPAHLYKRMKIVCTVLDLSIPKQTAAMIWDFVEVQEKNIENLKGIK